MSSSLTPNLGPATLWMPAAPSFSVPPGMPGTPGTPGPPGIGQSAPLSSNMAVPSATMDSSSAAVLRPIMSSGPVPSNPAIQQQIYPTYPSLPAVAASPQGLWLQPPQMGGLPRPPFLSYPACFSWPFSFASTWHASSFHSIT
ncbi:hypothetical protein L1049_022366 [Liquidambar formosana]|uniref:Uncharacterized protein n=1 Tax=Liquidambar formosana TaxID=63359 RepID=A0AAP0WNR7_LIQFO